MAGLMRGAALLLTLTASLQNMSPSTSGGDLSPEQAGYRIEAYDLSIEIDPERRFIDASAILTIHLTAPLEVLVLDLDTPLQVRSAALLGEAETKLKLERRGGQIRIELPGSPRAGAALRIKVDYSGHPRTASNPPWAGGFVWARTASGAPWVSVACQVDGADLWLPILDHPLGEPRRADLRVTVPTGLTVASNGTLQSVTEPRQGFQAFHWRSVNPINAYNLTVNVAPYETLTATYVSIDGTAVPITYWVLPEDLEKGRELFPQFARHLAFLEEKLGPYPFRNEKYGVAEVPYLGMEHQTIIAYGNRYRPGEFGFDWLHFHELAHEWWGNMVTARDWRDFWLHEGFASYMEALYAEEIGGRAALARYMQKFRARLRNRKALAPVRSQTSAERYFLSPDHAESDGDVNFKAAWVLHSLRFLVGDERFFEILRRFAYPTPSLEQVTDGSQCRFATTDDFQRTAERISGRDLSWFFEVYLRQPALPRLQVRKADRRLFLRWAVPRGLPFPMPVEIQVGSLRRLVEIPAEGVELDLGGERDVDVDPDGWVLRAE